MSEEKKMRLAAAFFVHDGAGNFVFHKRGPGTRDHRGTWDSGGGGVEPGEEIPVALMRELREEYGCTGQVDEALPSTFFVDEGGTPWTIHAFVIRVNREEVYIAEPECAEELIWCRLDAVPTPLHPGVANDLVMFKDILQKYSV